MTEQNASKKLLSIISMMGTGSNGSIVMGAIAQLNALVKDLKTLENENISLKARIQELESS